ncbi:beta-glucosidase [Duganella sp. FT80W]|uniref:Beta-glucosidase n=1 Tax=Duganella guangzhouensis TaxID=2666084 RepID=A0A6I2L990_9BURK|nr:glycoside hydrolase family 3 C-terminal domain-containing protein [Duganella guangzhouensis]MRW93266.1 beta-glucosidase [Duganella guangzhouensis]
MRSTRLHGVAAGLAMLLLAGCGGGGASSATNDSQTVATTGQLTSDQIADDRANKILATMSLSQKIQLVHGQGYVSLDGTLIGYGYNMRPDGVLAGAGAVMGLPALGIPTLNLVDAASGVNLVNSNATSLPSTLAVAASWDTDLSELFGRRIGIESRALGFAEALGGGINLARDPRDGRTFENLGEDPILAGELVSSRTIGVQAQQVISTVKHFAFNNYETNRYISNSVIDEQSMRETELLGFEIAVQKGKPGNVMCAFNQVNGTYSCEHAQMLGWLKTEWGFKGIVQSDWGANNSTVASANAGLDEEQPSQTSDDQKVPELMKYIVGTPYYINALTSAVASGEVPMARLDDMVRRKLRTMIQLGIMDNPPTAGGSVDEVNGNADALKVARESMVLLKNNTASGDAAPVLPLSASTVKSIAVIGAHADKGVIAGGGSGGNAPINGTADTTCPQAPDALFGSCANWYHSVPLDQIRKKFPNATVTFYSGLDADAAANGAAQADVAIVFAIAWQTEGVDNTTLALPTPATDSWNVEYDQDALISAVAAKAKRTVVVLETGGPVLMPWVSKVHAVLEAWYPGIQGAQALADILSGDVNPSGKLPITFPVSDADLPQPKLPTNVAAIIGSTVAPRALVPLFEQSMGAATVAALRAVNYNEKLWLGYKWYDAKQITPLFPFGHGLSYTSFSYADAKVSSDADQNVTVSFKLSNTGARAGSEIAQVYAALPSGTPGNQQPPKRLVGWKKVALAAGQSSTVSITVPAKYLSYWDATSKKQWVLQPGAYSFSVSASSAMSVEANPLTQKITLAGK